MKEILIAILGVASAVFGAKWFNPDFDQFPYIWKNTDIRISSDFVYVHFDFFADQRKDQPVDSFNGVPVFDKATYVENVDMHRTSAAYAIRLTSSGIEPEIKAIEPQVRLKTKRAPGEDRNTIEYTVESEADLDQNKEYALTGVSPSSPRMIYVFRNGFQGGNSLGGKDVKYPTEKLTLVYDFSSIRWSEYAETPTPSACLKHAKEDDSRMVPLNWQNGIAIVEAIKLQPGDKVRVFWTWRGQSPAVSCSDAL